MIADLSRVVVQRDVAHERFPQIDIPEFEAKSLKSVQENLSS